MTRHRPNSDAFIERRRARLLGGLAVLTTAVTVGSALAVSPALASTPASTLSPATSSPAAAKAAGRSASTTAVPLCQTPVSSADAQCFGLRLQQKGAQPFTATPSGYGPSDIRAAYNLPATGGGAGQTIAIIDAYDDPAAAADLAAYRKYYGLPALTAGQFRKVSQRGSTTDLPAANAQWSGEISLDIDAVTAVAPLANIILVEADDTSLANLGAAVNEGVALGAKFVSNSYGSPYVNGTGEDSSQLSGDAAYYNHPGVAVVASAGDDGYGVTFPASSPHVTSVGGTTLTKDTTTRGWSESVWNNQYGGTGSGCSRIQPKPAFQLDTGCANRSVADVSAVADPVTGLAVYDSYMAAGWATYGGTSLSSPLITATYALAGTPPAGTYPNSFPYAATSHLNDVTDGSNGSCTTSYFCSAGPGYDGPTGLGTPNGLLAFTSPAHGTIQGTVTDSTTGKPVASATITVGSGATAASTITDTHGKYTLAAAPGTYQPTATKYGYTSGTGATVTITKNGTSTDNITMAALPTETLSGTVRDGSGHGWPLYAQLTFSGVPGGTVFTNPATGKYNISLPAGLHTTLTATPVVAGYVASTQNLVIGSTPQSNNVALLADPNVPISSYTYPRVGLSETFDGTTIPAGWSTDGTPAPAGWAFDNPLGDANGTGGTGNFASVQSTDTTDPVASHLVTPAVDMTKMATPTLNFGSFDFTYGQATATIDLSTDGGSTWNTVTTLPASTSKTAYSIPLPAAAGKSNVKVRFSYAGEQDGIWEVDNVQLGDTVPAPIPGAQIEGLVTDKNTQLGLDGATVAAATTTTTTIATGDPALPDGYYQLFVPATAKTASVLARQPGYTTTTASPVTITNDALTSSNFALPAGRIHSTLATITAATAWHGATTKKVTITNTGTAPVTGRVTEGAGSFTLQHTTTKPATLTLPAPAVTGDLAAATRTTTPATKSAATATGSPADGSSWAPVAGLPVAVQANSSVSYNGVVYDFGGYDGGKDVSSLTAYRPGSGAWTTLASAHIPREKAAMVAYNGKIIVAGGFDSTSKTVNKVEIYTIATNKWATAATDPNPTGAAGYALIGSKLIMVGGCSGTTCGLTRTEIYDIATNKFTTTTPYPEAIAYTQCGEINGNMYCSGGAADHGSLFVETPHTYEFHAATLTWSAKADMIADPGSGQTGGEWGALTTAANGQLLLAGGAYAHATTIWSGTYAYNPATDSWALGAPLSQVVYNGGSAVGWYAIGGNDGHGNSTSTVNVLADFNQGEGSQVSWMTETPTTFTLAPGKSATVSVRINTNDPSITQPGTLHASVGFVSDTPYPTTQIPVTLTVKAPPTWGEIIGKISTTTSGKASAISGATIQINGKSSHYTFTTDANGDFALFLPASSTALQVIAAKDGFIPQVHSYTIRAGRTTTANLTLTSTN